MKIIVSGGTGFIGTQLIKEFSKKPYEMMVISRTKSKNSYENVTQITWGEIELKPQILEGYDAWINLAGETINQRWNASAREKIRESRIYTTRRVAQCMGQLYQPPKVVINGSAVGFYGHATTETFDETSNPQAEDFLAEVVQSWEQESRFIPAQRVIQLRTGVVLGLQGGALPQMMLPYKYGLGGKVGSGKQWVSWIHIHDVVRMIEHCMVNTEINGPVNATAPYPVTNNEFGQALGKAMHRPHFFPVPAFVLQLMFGEMSDLLLKGQRVVPKKSLKHHFIFRYPNIELALNDLLQDFSS